MSIIGFNTVVGRRLESCLSITKGYSKQPLEYILTAHCGPYLSLRYRHIYLEVKYKFKHAL